MATPEYAGFKFVGASGKTYMIDAYVSDVNGATVRFDNGAGAGTASAEFITFDENVFLADFSMVTGTADTEKIRLLVNSRPTQHVLRYVPHLTTNANRPTLQIGFKAGARISAIQISD
jgi:hypothetical protein